MIAMFPESRIPGWMDVTAAQAMSSPIPSPLRDRVRSAAKALLGRRSLPVLLALVAMVLTLPALGVGWVMDDYYHRTVLLGNSELAELLGPPSHMFRFFNDDSERTGRMIDLGFCPWWTYPGVKAEFMQTLTVQTHRLDYRLWPDSPVLMHAQNLLWFALVVGAMTVMYRRMFAVAWMAGLAALLFAIEDAHGTPAGWIANRNVLLAVFFGACTWIAHDLWRRDGWRTAAVVAPLLLICSLLSKEAGIATCAYLAAYAWFLDRAGWLRGSATLIPYTGVVVAWRIIRDGLGYGVENVGLYVDPISDPGRFLSSAAERAPILLLGQWGWPPSDVAALLPPAGLRVLWALAVVFLLLVLVAFLPLLRRDRLARFWMAGMLFSVIPICAAFPMDRLLFFAGVGAMGLISQFLAAVLGNPDNRAGSRWGRTASVALAWFFVLLHLILAPMILPLRAAWPVGPKHLMERLMLRPSVVGAVAGKDVLIVNPPSTMHAGYLPILCELEGVPMPRTTRVLASGILPVTARRTDEQTLAIRPENGYVCTVLDRLFRPPRRPMSIGQRVELTGVTAEVAELTADNRPAEVWFQFDVPLEDPSLRWLCFRNGRFEPFQPPKEGETVELRIRGPSLRDR